MDVKNVFGDYNGSVTEDVLEKIRSIESLKLKADQSNTESSIYSFNYFDYLKDKTLNEEGMDFEEIAKELVPLFEGLPNWNNPETLLNVIPPANIPALATTLYTKMFNPNFSQDKYTGLLLASELEVVKYLSDLIGWDWTKSMGTFTFGGKGTSLYAFKYALNRAYPIGKRKGYNGKEFFLVSSVKGHPCHAEISDWLGIGYDNCIRVKCSKDGRIIVSEVEKVVRENIEKGKIFLGFNLCGGSTVEFDMDPVKEIYELREQLVADYRLDYKPIIHVDSVVGWIWLFYNGYDFETNSLGINKPILDKIQLMNSFISEIKYADSCGMDFHKTGYAPYISSLIMFHNKEDYYFLGDKEQVVDVEKLQYGGFAPFEQTLELTRCSDGPIAAWTTLKTIGINGYREIIANSLESTQYFRDKINALPFAEVVNANSNGVATLFILKPEGFEDKALAEILTMPKEETDKVKNYNLNFTRYVDELNEKGETHLAFTASDVFTVAGTNVCLGSIKAYPMSPHYTKENIDAIVALIATLKERYDRDENWTFKTLHYIPADMVYRR